MRKPIPCPDGLCSAPSCQDTANLLSPVPLCAHHLRITYEFCLSLVDERWADAVEQSRPKQQAELPLLTGKDGYRMRPGWVYFIRKADLIKIGWSGTPRKRFYVLQPDEVLVLIEGTMMDEQRYHARFNHLREYGEWFRPEADLLACIKDLNLAIA